MYKLIYGQNEIILGNCFEIKSSLTQLHNVQKMILK